MSSDKVSAEERAKWLEDRGVVPKIQNTYKTHAQIVADQIREAERAAVEATGLETRRCPNCDGAYASFAEAMESNCPVCDERAAYRRGQEAMRRRAVKCARDFPDEGGWHCAPEMEALPIEDEQGEGEACTDPKS